MALQARQRPEFDDPDHRRIYEFIERRGRASPADVADATGMEPERFNHELAILKRDGYIEERHGELVIVLEAGAAEEFVDGGVEYIVRPAWQRDLSGVVGTIRQIAEEKTSLVAESVGEQLDYEGVLNRHNEVQTRMFFVATVHDDVVGWAHLEAPELEKLDHAAQITVGVLEEYRRHGIGGHLVERSLEWAAQQGYEKVYNSIPATNDHGAEFLNSRGFHIEAVRQDHYKINGEYVDEVMLARRLTQLA